MQQKSFGSVRMSAIILFGVLLEDNAIPLQLIRQRLPGDGKAEAT